MALQSFMLLHNGKIRGYILRKVYDYKGCLKRYYKAYYLEGLRFGCFISGFGDLWCQCLAVQGGLRVAPPDLQAGKPRNFGNASRKRSDATSNESLY